MKGVNFMFLDLVEERGESGVEEVVLGQFVPEVFL